MKGNLPGLLILGVVLVFAWSLISGGSTGGFSRDEPSGSISRDTGGSNIGPLRHRNVDFGYCRRCR